MTIQQKQLHYQPYIDWIIDEHEKQKTVDYFKFAGYQFLVKPPVFNPNIATSSKLFAEEILKLDLTGKKVLDAGCGSGILSIAALKAGASFVYSFDINDQAVETTKENLARLDLTANIFEVQQRNSLPDLPNLFDYIFFNPPFFDCNTDAIWKRSVCDPEKLFLRNVISNAKKVLRPDGQLMMVIGGELNPKYIKSRLIKYGFSEVEQKYMGGKTPLNLHFIIAQK